MPVALMLLAVSAPEFNVPVVDKLFSKLYELAKLKFKLAPLQIIRELKSLLGNVKSM